MDNPAGLVYFNHGKESGPWGTKIKRLAEVAQARGFHAESPDYTGMADPDQRVRHLLSLQPRSSRLVLVGSSMGGYVAMVASETLDPQGLFLMAPALYVPGYAIIDPFPNARLTAIVHGWNDEVIPVEHSIRFAQTHKTQLHLVDGDHRLMSQVPFIEALFGLFLDHIQLPRVPV